MAWFSKKRGIVIACDVADLDSLVHLIKVTADLPFICGYKIGMELALTYGLHQIMKTCRQLTVKPLIYDHQKFGTDIPEICGGKVLDIFVGAGIDGIIIFPLAGLKTLRSAVEGSRSRGMEPIVGGEMTHNGYLLEEGGYIENSSPSRMYRDAALMGVKVFVVPGTRLASIRKHRETIEAHVPSPSYLFPGVGKGQGGDIVEAFAAVAPNDSYAIVGRGIYAEADPGQAASRLWSAVKQRFGE